LSTFKSDNGVLKQLRKDYFKRGVWKDIILRIIRWLIIWTCERHLIVIWLFLSHT